jgi:hypothetical protein
MDLRASASIGSVTLTLVVLMFDGVGNECVECAGTASGTPLLDKSAVGGGPRPPSADGDRKQRRGSLPVGRSATQSKGVPVARLAR